MHGFSTLLVTPKPRSSLISIKTVSINSFFVLMKSVLRTNGYFSHEIQKKKSNVILRD